MTSCQRTVHSLSCPICLPPSQLHALNADQAHHASNSPADSRTLAATLRAAQTLYHLLHVPQTHPHPWWAQKVRQRPPAPGALRVGDGRQHKQSRPSNRTCSVRRTCASGHKRDRSSCARRQHVSCHFSFMYSFLLLTQRCDCGYPQPQGAPHRCRPATSRGRMGR